MKQLEVQIMQQSYVLGCPPGNEAKLLEAVVHVDAAMTRIRDAGKVRSRERIAVLAALNVAMEREEQRTEIERLQAEIADLQARLAAAELAHAQGTPAADVSNLEADEQDRLLEALIGRIDHALTPAPVVDAFTPAPVEAVHFSDAEQTPQAA